MIKLPSLAVTNAASKIVNQIRCFEETIWGFVEAIKYDFKVGNKIMPSARAEYLNITKQEFLEKLLRLTVGYGHNLLSNPDYFLYKICCNSNSKELDKFIDRGKKNWEQYKRSQKEYVEYWLKEPAPPDLVSVVSIYCTKHVHVILKEEMAFYDARFNSVSGLVEKLALCHNCFSVDKIRATLASNFDF